MYDSYGLNGHIFGANDRYNQMYGYATKCTYGRYGHTAYIYSTDNRYEQMNGHTTSTPSAAFFLGTTVRTPGTT